MRDTMGTWAFETTMQGNPTSPEAFEWPAELFRNVYVDEMPRHVNHLVVACDPATGRRPRHKGSDYTAIVALGAPGDGNFYVDAIMQRTAFRQTIEGMAKLIGRLPRSVDAIGIETNGFQGELRTQAIQVLRAEYGIHAPILGLENRTSSKILRIRSLDPLLQKRQLRFVDNRDTRLLVQQLKEFGHPDAHDDGPDGLEMATRLLRTTVSRK